MGWQYVRDLLKGGKMKDKKMKIGFAGNLYFTPKGHSYVNDLLVRTVLEAGHEAHMYRILDNAVIEEFTHPTSLTTCPDQIIPKEDFEKWLDEVKPEVCVFTEYAQWWEEDHDKLQICKDRGIKTLGFVVLEKLDIDKVEHYKLYTHIMCPTMHQRTVMRKMGCYNATYVPWGDFDSNYENIIESKYQTGKTTFLHIAGSGGVDDRKNTNAIIEAYKEVHDSTTDLKITHLNAKAFSKEEILSFMKAADVVVNTSKWDTIGLCTIEANKMGVPVIVADGAPMNELVLNNYNGLTVESEISTSKYVSCPVFNTKHDALVKAFNMCKNPDILGFLKMSAKKFAEKNFDWDKNKKAFLECLT